MKWFTEADVSIADDPELLDLMRESGCRQVLIGLESPVGGELEGVEMRSNWKRSRAAGYEDAVRYFVARKSDVFCLHVLSEQELDPPLTGDLKLMDMEEQDPTEITVSGPLLKAYKRQLSAFLEGLRQFCSTRGASYLTASTALPFDRLVLEYLRSSGLVR